MVRDAGFLLAKAQQRVRSFVERANILVLASHSLEICRQWCTKAVLMERGEIREIGDIEPVLAAYAKGTDE